MTLVSVDSLYIVPIKRIKKTELPRTLNVCRPQKNERQKREPVIDGATNKRKKEGTRSSE